MARVRVSLLVQDLACFDQFCARIFGVGEHDHFGPILVALECQKPASTCQSLHFRILTGVSLRFPDEQNAFSDLPFLPVPDWGELKFQVKNKNRF
jgi:hypothetical protein